MVESALDVFYKKCDGDAAIVDRKDDDSAHWKREDEARRRIIADLAQYPEQE